MNKLYIIVFLVGILFSCSDSVDQQPNCELFATVVDMTGLDGCGFMFQTDDGQLYEPVFPSLFCGTPPLPEGDPMEQVELFEFYHGQRVSFSYIVFDGGSVCMTGTLAYLTCLREVKSSD